MRKISQIIFILIISIAIACIANITEAGTEVIIDNNYQLISSKRVGRTYYEYTYQITMINNGPDVKNVIATVTSTSPNTTIIDGNVNVGSIASGDTIISTDTFTIKQNRKYSFDLASLVWNLQYEIAAQIIPPEGGEIQGEDGIVFIVPEGATTEPISVTITALQENNLGTAPPPNTTFLGGAVIDMGQNELMDNANISMPAPNGVPDGAEVYLAKLVEYAGQIMYQMIDTAIVQNGIIVSQDPAFPGITGSGTYCFIWAQDVGWIEGQVTNINSGMAVPGAVVTLSGGYWLDIADENGYYSLPAWAGNFIVNAFDDQTGDHGEKQGSMPSNDVYVFVNIEIGESIGPVQGSLINGNFETGDLTGWEMSGAADVVDSFGPISPYEGNSMAMISSGNGAIGDASSALEQSFTVPADATKLVIHYNFVSEEYPEFVGSQYNDVFYATLHTPDGSREIAFEEVNSANFEAVSGIPCGSGDCTWGQTGWLQASVDVSEWAGTDDTLTLTVRDVGDTIFDTVVLLDNIVIESSNCEIIPNTNTALLNQHINNGEIKCYQLNVMQNEKVAILSAGNSNLRASLYDGNHNFIGNSNGYQTTSHINSVSVDSDNFMLRPGILEGNYQNQANHSTYIIEVELESGNHGDFSLVVLKINDNNRTDDFFAGLRALLNDNDSSNDYLDVYVHALFPELEETNYGNTIDYGNVPRERQCKALVNFYMHTILNGQYLFSDCYIDNHLSNNDHDYILQDDAILLYNQNSTPTYYNHDIASDINSVVFQVGDAWVKAISLTCSGGTYISGFNHYGLFISDSEIIDANWSSDGRLQIAEPRWGYLKVARPNF